MLRFFLTITCAAAAFCSPSPSWGQAPEKPDAAQQELAKSITSLPRVAVEIHEAMQSRAYQQAVTAIDAELEKEDVEAKDYLLYLKAIALTEAKKYDQAISTFEKLEKDYPGSTWISRSKFGRANVFVLRRQYIDAGAIYKQEAQRLLSRGRKDELAKVYLEFADRYFQGVPASDPSQKKKPDYKQALTYYSEVEKLGPTTKLLQRVQFRIARCHQELAAHEEAIKAYQQFLNRHGGEDPPSGLAAPAEMLSQSKFNLAAMQLAAGRRTQARKTWQEFLNQYGNETDDDQIADLLARAKFQLSHTYGMPGPPNIRDLELGVAASEAFLQDYPQHELAAQAELEIAQAYSRHARHRQGIDRLLGLIDNPHYKDAKQVPVARQMLGQAYLTQRQFDDAIAAWKDFLNEHPTDSKWSAVQKWVVDAEYAKASYAAQQKEYDEARTLWQTFLNKYPLDSRAVNILVQFGEMKYRQAAEIHKQRIAAAGQRGKSAQTVKLSDECEKLFLEAISDWRRVVAKYPDDPSASRAAMWIGKTLEDRFGQMKEALEAYKKVRGSEEGNAKRRIQALTSPHLKIVTERKFRSDEQARIKLATRNLEKVTVKTYRVDMTDYFRKMHLASGVETLDIALIDPDQQFEYQVPDYQRYRQIEGDIEIKTDGPGVTAVTVSSEKLEATTMLVVSDLDVIVKSSRNELFLFAENMPAGKPLAGVSVLISDGSEVFAEEITGADGVLQKSYPQLKSVGDLRVFAVHEGHVASTVNDLNGLKFAVGLNPRGYLFTDRPAYRAGQLVNIKGVVRWVKDDRFAFNAGEKFTLDIYDVRGRQLQRSKVTLSGFGTIHDNIVLPDTAPQGDYRVHLHRAKKGPSDPIGALSFETRFKVTQYKLEPIDVTIDLEKDVYFRGEKVTGNISVAYYYGTPLAGETVQYRFGEDGELHTSKTDKAGKIAVEFDTDRFAESQPVSLTVIYPNRALTRGKTVYLATRGFAITASTVRDVFIGGESFETLFQVNDPAANPIQTELKIEVFQQTNINGQRGEQLVQTHDANTDKQGQARQSLTIDDAGVYFVRATGEDQFGNNVSGQTRIAISGEKDSVRLRILADQHSFNVGDTAHVNLHWRGPAAVADADKQSPSQPPDLALVTFEGAKVLSYRLIELKPGNNKLSFPVESDFAPNFFLSAAVMQRNEFHEATTPLRVEQKLRLNLNADRQQLRPGEDLLLEVETTDVQGNPVQAEVALAMVQTNLLNVFQDAQGVINAFFSAGKRTASVRQATSCTFKYLPKTRGVSKFLLAEAERVATLEREARALSRLGRAGNRALAFDVNGDGVATAGRMMEELSDEDVTIGFDGIAGLSQQTMQNDIQRLIPQVRFRTEIVDGRQVQVPYTEQLSLGYNVQVPVVGDFAVQFMEEAELYEQYESAAREWSALSRRRIDTGRDHDLYLGAQISVPQRGMPMQYKGQIDRFYRQLGTVNALTPQGEFKALNNRGEDELQRLVAEQGVQLFPMLAHAETAFWNPTIVTDEKGKATVTIPMPNRSTAWRLRGKAINTKTLSGQSEIDLITKKDLFGDMKLPTALTAGDQAVVPVEIHHASDGAESIDVTLKVTLGEKSTEQHKTVDVQGPGIDKVDFKVAAEAAGEAEFQLEVSSGEQKDTTTSTVLVRPYGFPVFATASGTSAQSTVALVDFDEKLKPLSRELEIVIGGDVNRALLRSVIDSGNAQLLRCGLPTAGPLERSVSDILGGVAMLEAVGLTRDADTPEGQALSGRISGAVTQLISSQHDEGGWSWGGRLNEGSVDHLLSARIMWALSAAKSAGFAVAQDRFSKGQSFLKTAFSTTASRDLEHQAIVLHAMAASDCGDFALANRLYRERNRLSLSGLCHLTLALSELNHNEMASDILELVDFGTGAGAEARRGRIPPWMASEIELKALYLLALEEIDPRNPAGAKTANQLMSSRIGSRWPVEKANGPAIAALARWHSRTKHAAEKYKLTVSVNDRELVSFTVDPIKDSSRTLNVPAEFIRGDKPQRLEFKLDGRGRFSYSAVLTGFVPADQLAATTKTWTVKRRYEPARRMFDGREVPRGFDVVNGSYRSFTNPLTQLPVGGRGEVTLSPRRYITSTGSQQFDYLVLTDPIPAGCSVLEDSIKGTFERYEIQPGQITFYVGNRRHPGDFRYTLVGYVPGDYRGSQSILRSFYDPSQFAIATVKSLKILKEDEQSVDEYRLTPDELYHLGQKYFERKDYKQAHAHLTQLLDGWRLDVDKYKSTTERLFKSSLAMKNHSDTVRYFEILKERFPDVELTFEEILQVADSYREIGEYERSYLVYRATVEGSFERESQVAGFLDARGQFLRSVQAMEKLLRDYPAESYVEIASHALAQEVYRRAPSAADDKNLKGADVTRVDLINASIHMLDHLVTTWPEDPANDQASFALATALIDLDQYKRAIGRCQRYASRYPDSRLLDSFWYMIGYCHFELQQHDEALQMCRKVAETTFPVPESGGSRSADNKWEAIYIMGQIYHSLGQAAEAIGQYTRVKQRFADAAEAIKFFSHKDISLDEVTTIKPGDPKQVSLKFRNIAEAAIKVYRIDLMKFGLMQRNLDRITAINLAGIKPYHEETVALGDGKDFRDREKPLELPLDEEGAYLLVCRGESLYASGLVLVSPLKLSVSEDETSGRVRVSVKDTTNEKFVGDVHVKVIGTGNEEFISGETDLRGLFIADDVKGICTAIAVSDAHRYAFYRGKVPIQGFAPEGEPFAQEPAQQAEAAQEAQAQPAPQAKQSGKDLLRSNIFGTNDKFQEEQQDNYEGLLNNERKGVKSKEAY